MRRCMIDPNGTEGSGEASSRASCGLLQRAGFLYGVYGSTTRGIPRFAVAVLGFPGKIKIFISFHFTCSAPSCWRIGFRGAPPRRGRSTPGWCCAPGGRGARFDSPSCTRCCWGRRRTCRGARCCCSRDSGDGDGGADDDTAAVDAAAALSAPAAVTAATAADASLLLLLLLLRPTAAYYHTTHAATTNAATAATTRLLLLLLLLLLLCCCCCCCCCSLISLGFGSTSLLYTW